MLIAYQSTNNFVVIIIMALNTIITSLHIENLNESIKKDITIIV